MAEQRQRRMAWAWTTAWLILSPVFYVLSAGPVGWLADRGYIADRWRAEFDLLYLPAQYFYELDGPIGYALRWYLSFWR